MDQRRRSGPGSALDRPHANFHGARPRRQLGGGARDARRPRPRFGAVARAKERRELIHSTSSTKKSGKMLQYPRPNAARSELRDNRPYIYKGMNAELPLGAHHYEHARFGG